MVLTPYKQNQGVYARGAAGAALLVLALFGSWRFALMVGVEQTFYMMGMKVPYATFWGAGMFLVLAFLVSLFVFGLRTGWVALDGRSGAFVDLLIDTQAELQKVSWPSREELRRYTMVVLICILVVGVFLYVVDMIVSYSMTSLRVLPG